MRGIGLVLACLAGPVLADGPVPGSYAGSVTTLGTTMTAVYSPITGVTLQPQAQVQVAPSPFGPLILTADGWYKMPVLGHSGRWHGGVAFDGPLAAMNPRLSGKDATITLDIPLGDGTVQSADYALIPPEGAAP